MDRYVYKAKDKSGQEVRGEVESLSTEQAARALQEHGLLVISVSPKQRFDFMHLSRSISRVSATEVTTFTRLIATMLKAGLPLVDALSDLNLQTNNTYFKEIITSLLHDVQAGTSLSAGMARYPKVFNNLYISLVKAGEASGKVEESMEKLADMLDADLEFKGKIKGAMIYPAIVTTAMIAVGIFMVTTIIPKIGAVYKDFGADLPLPTQILLGISNAIQNYLILVLAFIALVIITLRVIYRNPAGQFLINNMAYQFPVIGPLKVEISLSILTRTLGTLVGAGVAILDALKIAGNVMGNDQFGLAVQKAAATVEKGLPLSVSLRRSAEFPLMVSQLVAIGEETGTLDQSLLRVSAFYQDSAERKVKALTTALEPVMIIIMGIAVGGMAIAVLLPMFNLVNVIH